MSKMIEIGISPDSQQRFEKLIRETQKTVKADMPKVVRNAARDVSRQLVRVTPIGRGKTRGFAKAGWGMGMQGLGMRPAAFYFQNNAARPARWREFGSFKNNLHRKESPSFELTNEVPFIEEMKGSSQVVPHAFHNASRSYEKRLTKLGRRMAGKWKR
jgi:hypothetical protein